MTQPPEKCPDCGAPVLTAVRPYAGQLRRRIVCKAGCGFKAEQIFDRPARPADTPIDGEERR